MRTVKEWTVVVVSTLSLTLMTCRVNAQTPSPVHARNIVLVHGAWADGSSWSEVIPRLQVINLLKVKPGKQDALIALLRQNTDTVVRTLGGWKTTRLIAAHASKFASHK
jgi:hypothetical protein